MDDRALVRAPPLDQRILVQAVPLLITEAPAVGTGLEYRAAVDTGDVKLAVRPGTVVYADANAVVVRASISYSWMCTDDRTSSLTRRSERMIASSKL